MMATPTIAHCQTLPKRLEEETYQLSATTTHDIEKYSFIINSYQPIGTSLSATDSFLPVITSRISRSLAKRNTSMLSSARKCHAATVQEGGRK